VDVKGKILLFIIRQNFKRLHYSQTHKKLLICPTVIYEFCYNKKLPSRVCMCILSQRCLNMCVYLVVTSTRNFISHVALQQYFLKWLTISMHHAKSMRFRNWVCTISQAFQSLLKMFFNCIGSKSSCQAIIRRFGTLVINSRNRNVGIDTAISVVYKKTIKLY